MYQLKVFETGELEIVRHPSLTHHDTVAHYEKNHRGQSFYKALVQNTPYVLATPFIVRT